MIDERTFAAWPDLQLRPLVEVDGGQRNVIVLVEDRHGSRWALRGHARDRDPQRAEWQASLQTFLASAGYPAPAHARTRTQSFVTVHNGMPWSLAAWLPGSPYDYGNTSEAEAAGHALAKLHDVAGTFPTPAVVMVHNRATSAWLTDPQAELERLAKRFGGETQTLRWIEQLLIQLPPTLTSDLPAGLVHGDFHGTNLAFVDDQVVGVFDFDVIQPDFLITDIARATVKFARPSRSNLDLRSTFALAFLSGYQTVRPLTDVEVRLAPALWPIAHLRTSARYELADQLGDNSRAAFDSHIAAARAAERLAMTLDSSTHVAGHSLPT